MDEKPTNRWFRGPLRLPSFGVPKSPAQRRWYGFSLLSFLLVAHVAIVFALVAHQRAGFRRELEIVKELRAAGAAVNAYQKGRLEDPPADWLLPPQQAWWRRVV